MQEQEIFDHIETGRHQELYHEWATSGTWSVRYKLARKGYELDTLVHDKNEVIRDTAMMQYPEKVPAYLNSEPNMEQMYQRMLNLTYIDSRVLTCQIDYWTDQKGYDSEPGHNIVSTLKTKKASVCRKSITYYFMRIVVWILKKPTTEERLTTTPHQTNTLRTRIRLSLKKRKRT